MPGTLRKEYLSRSLSNMKKLIFISNMPAPYQVKFCYELNNHFNTEFWFYESINERDAWWNIDLGPRCKLIPGVKGKKTGKYLTLNHLAWLEKFDPDIVMLGGFSIPANYLAYRWAKRNNKKVVVITEVSRTKDGVLRRYGAGWKLLRRLYNKIDAVFAVTTDAVTQFKNDFKFGEKVIKVHYAYDLDPYFKHPLRSEHAQERVILFANRLIDIYNPLGALRIFYEVQLRHPLVSMKMNGSGDLRKECEELIAELKLEKKVSFLDAIPSWDTLHEVYRDTDILLLPAKFSNGNFTIYEAMASGMGIVISDNILYNGKEIKNGENGFNLPLDEQLFADKIIAYLEQPALITSHAEKNRKAISWLTLGSTAQYYKEVLDKLQ